MDDFISRQQAIYIVLQPNKLPWQMSEEIRALPPVHKNNLEKSIEGKTPEEIYDFLCWLMFEYGRQWDNSRLGIIDWISR